MFDKKCQSRKCCLGTSSPSKMSGVMGAIPSLLHGALLAVGILSVTRFVYCKLKRCNKNKLARDLKNCKDDVVAFAQDACEEVCECMTDSDLDCDMSEGVGGE